MSVNIVVNGEIRETEEKELLSRLWAATSDPDTVINILINSGGGDGDAIMAAIELIKGLQQKNWVVRTICLGRASSAAAMLLMAGSPGHRYIVPNGEVMIHRGTFIREIRGDVDPSLWFAQIQRTIKKFEEFHVSIVGDSEKVMKWLSTDTYFTAEEAVKAGLVDHIGLP